MNFLEYYFSEVKKTKKKTKKKKSSSFNVNQYRKGWTGVYASPLETSDNVGDVGDGGDGGGE